MLAPGFIVGLVLSEGSVHTYSLIIVLMANVVLYAAATFFALKALGR
jgi:hypothetical protein